MHEVTCRWPRFATAMIVAAICVEAGAQQAIHTSLGDLSLEELSNIEVTSVSRRAQRLSDAAASIFVITGDDIRRSGATSLPEALRLAPNLFVVRAHSFAYGAAARGFASASGNKMLVLIDGRSVYTPLFSGVFWDVQDVMLEDIDRIEVISGPGGTLWGVNAVNGIINVITRSSRDTQGGIVALGAGNQETQGAVRFGAAPSEQSSYRVYAKYFDHQSTQTAAGTPKDDSMRKGQAGFRADWALGSDRVAAQGNAYRGEQGQPPPGVLSTGAVIPFATVSVSGANLLARWTRPLQRGSDLTVLAYYDRTERIVRPQFAETLDIADVQVQYSAPPLSIHALHLGAEYRVSRDRLINSQFVAFLPARVSQEWVSLFAQDDISLTESLRASIGARVERNDYTGNEFLPSARLAWKVADDQLLWAAASRTVRAPSRLDRDTFVPGTPPFLLIGGPDVRSEVADVYELGYRGRITQRATLSVTVFQADYDHLVTQEFRLNPTAVFFGNGMEGRASGIELWGTFDLSRSWRMSAGYAKLDRRLQLKPGSVATAALASEGSDPENRWSLRSSHDLPGNVEFDAFLRYTSALTSPTVPEYTAVDARVAWSPRPDLELSLTGQNLFDSGHGEFTDVATRTEFGRMVFFKVVSRF